MFSWSSSPAASSGRRCAAVEEPLDLVVGSTQAGGQGAELVDVLLAGERPGAQRVGVGHGDLVDDHACRR